MTRLSKWRKILQLRVEAQTRLENSYQIEQKALKKLETAEKLLQEAAIYLSNAKRVNEVNKLRQKKLDHAFVRFNKAKILVEKRKFEEQERELFKRDSITQV